MKYTYLIRENRLLARARGDEKSIKIPTVKSVCVVCVRARAPFLVSVCCFELQSASGNVSKFNNSCSRLPHSVTLTCTPALELSETM